VGGGVLATRCTATAGKWGKTKRSSRATHSAPHLGRGRTVEGDRRRRAVCNRDGTGGAGGGEGGLGKEGELVVAVRGATESRAGPFIGAGRSVRRGYFEFGGAPMARNGGSGKIPTWTPAGGILGRLGAV
jgi:hypothetical protein